MAKRYSRTNNFIQASNFTVNSFIDKMRGEKAYTNVATALKRRGKSLSCPTRHSGLESLFRARVSFVRLSLRPGPHWLLKCNDAGDGTSCKKKFNLAPRSWKEYKGTRFYSGQQALVVERLLNRVEEDASVPTLRSRTQNRMQMPRSHQWPCSSTRPNCAPLVSRCEK